MIRRIGVKDPGECKFDEMDVTSRLVNIILDMPAEQQLDLLKKLDKSQYEGARRHERHCLKHPWVIAVDSEKDEASHDNFIKDISRCGMFIETRRAFLAGEKVTLSFQVPASQKRYKITGEIVRFQKNGVGVKFKRGPAKY